MEFKGCSVFSNNNDLKWITIDDGLPNSLEELFELPKEQYNKLKENKVQFACWFHPTLGYHEFGCSHMEWTKEQLIDILKDEKLKVKVLQKQILKLEAEREK